jgi:chaperonin cofactor prefoldin
MNKTSIILVLLLIISVLVGALEYINVHDKLGAAQSLETSAQSQLNAAQRQQDTTTAQLNTTQASLNKATAETHNLNSQVNALISQVNALKTQLNQAQTSAASSQNSITTLQNELNQANSELQLYHETGITIYSGVQPQVIDEAGANITLTRNPAAENPTWAELKSFILADKTDSNPYIVPTYTCADYARDVYDNAEAAGIRAAFVAVKFQGQSTGHALDAFVTTDQGLIYIDCSGIAPGQAGPANNDSTVVVKRSTEYQPQFIIPQGWVYSPMGIVDTIAIYW